MNPKEILRVVTSNGMRELTEVRALQAMQECAAQAFEEGQKQMLSDIAKGFKKNIHRAEISSYDDVFLAISEIIENFPLSKNPYVK